MTNDVLQLIDDLRLLHAPVPLLVLWLALLALVVLGAAGFSFWRRHQAKLLLPPVTRAAEVAHEDALAKLKAARKLIGPGNSKPYGIEVSGIVRRYIEVRFAIVAPRRSTEEFLAEAQVSPKLEPNHQKLLANFLGSCDLFKFARTHAEPVELTTLHEAAVRFVTDTRIVPTPAATPSAAATTQPKEAV